MLVEFFVGHLHAILELVVMDLALLGVASLDEAGDLFPLAEANLLNSLQKLDVFLIAPASFVLFLGSAARVSHGVERGLCSTVYEKTDDS